MSLYFKFVKTLNVAFFVAAVVAILPISYYWSTSAWSDKQKSLYMETGALKFGFFYTTMGSLGGTSYVCDSAYEGESIELSCRSGDIVRIEAYFGDPAGACSCPADQSIVSTTGRCPANPDHSDNSYGACIAEYGEEDDKTGIKACFPGQMWNGDTCCAYDLDPTTHVPDFKEMAMIPNLECNSASAQYIAQGACLGQQNCTFHVVSNHTFEWEVRADAPCIEGFQEAEPSGPGATCISTLESPNSNMTKCPRNMDDRRFIVRGICSSDTFQVDWIEDGKEQSRAEWALGMSWIDAVLTFMMFCVCIWMAEKEESAVFINDMHCCSADDYTLRIMHLKPPKQGASPDLDKLKRKIRDHFDKIVNDQKPVIMQRPVKVLDINFGLNNQDQIRNMKVRGAMARVLDLETEKLDLMNKYHVNTEKEIFEQHCKVRVLKVQFLQICEKVKFRKTRLEARTAFVTFASEEGYERCRKAYKGKHDSWKAFFFGRDKKLQLQLGSGATKTKKANISRQNLDLHPVMRPSDYIWEHLSTAPMIRFVKVSISNLLALAILVIGFTIIIKAKDVESAAKLALGETDCTLYEYAYSGEIEWESVYALNSTKSQVTREDVVAQLYPEHYNTTYPEPGLLGCYCQHVLSVDPINADKVEFRNPEMDPPTKEPLCDAYFDELINVQIMTYLAVGAVVVVNELLKTFFRALVAFGR